MDTLTNVKWAGPNTPYIRLINSSRQLILSKAELVDLRNQIDLFMEYYKESFVQPSISWLNLDNNWELL